MTPARTSDESTMVARSWSTEVPLETLVTTGTCRPTCQRKEGLTIAAVKAGPQSASRDHALRRRGPRSKVPASVRQRHPVGRLETRACNSQVIALPRLELHSHRQHRPLGVPLSATEAGILALPIRAAERVSARHRPVEPDHDRGRREVDVNGAVCGRERHDLGAGSLKLSQFARASPRRHR
jgi:hypothetical protein